MTLTSLGDKGEGTRRMRGHMWPRKPGAPPLPRPPPTGYRPPNGLIWGHGFDEFCWVERYTDIPNVVTMWSRSMLKEHAEMYSEALELVYFDCPDVVAKPRRRRPWPVLKLKDRETGMKMDPPLGVIDEGSDHEAVMPWEAVLEDEDEDEDRKVEGEDKKGKGKAKESPADADNEYEPTSTGYYELAHRGFCNDPTEWCAHITKKRVHRKTGRSRFYVRPPPNFHSTTLADLNAAKEKAQLTPPVTKEGERRVSDDEPHDADTEDADEETHDMDGDDTVDGNATSAVVTPATGAQPADVTDVLASADTAVQTRTTDIIIQPAAIAKDEYVAVDKRDTQKEADETTANNTSDTGGTHLPDTLARPQAAAAATTDEDMDMDQTDTQKEHTTSSLEPQFVAASAVREDEPMAAEGDAQTSTEKVADSGAAVAQPTDAPLSVQPAAGTGKDVDMDKTEDTKTTSPPDHRAPDTPPSVGEDTAMTSQGDIQTATALERVADSEDAIIDASATVHTADHPEADAQNDTQKLDSTTPPVSQSAPIAVNEDIPMVVEENIQTSATVSASVDQPATAADAVNIEPKPDAPTTPLDPREHNAPFVEEKAVAVEHDADVVLADATAKDETSILPENAPGLAIATPTGSDDTTPTPTPKAKHANLPTPKVDFYSRTGIPVLQEDIPAAYFPDTLIVHDPHGASMVCGDRYYNYSSYGDPRQQNFTDDEDGMAVASETEDTGDAGEDRAKKKRKAFVYKRVYPAPRPTPTQPAGEDVESTGPTAHLYMLPAHRSGVGHHSHVYQSPLVLSSPLTTYTSSSARPGTVLVAAKLAIQQRNARQLLASEAAMYASFPQHLSDEYCGWHLLSPFMHSPAPSGAVVPKFYGYYVPVYEENEKRDEKGKLKYPWQKRSPILLMEDCGKPIEAWKLNRDERAECYSLLMRLHFADYLHGSFHERNIVIQPGPLTAPPIARSLKTPSFRVIDFGRTITWGQWLKTERENDLAKDLGKAGNGTGNSVEEKKRNMSELEIRYRSLDENPYWRCFEAKMAQEWRDARQELQFDQVEAI